MHYLISYYMVVLTRVNVKQTKQKCAWYFLVKRNNTCKIKIEILIDFFGIVSIATTNIWIK